MCTLLFICSFTTLKPILLHNPEPRGPCLWDPKTCLREARTPFRREPSAAYFRSELTALKDLRTEWFLSVPLFSSTCGRYNFAHVSIHSEVTCRRTSRMGFPRVQGTFVSPKLFLRKILRKHIYVCDLILI